MGNLAYQSLRCDTTTFRRCSSTVSMHHSIIPSKCRCRGMVHVLLTSRPCKTYYIRQNWKSRPWSQCTVALVVFWNNRSWQPVLPPLSTPLGWEGCRPPVTWWNNPQLSRCISSLGHSEVKALLHRWLSFRMGSQHCTDTQGPDCWFRDRNWLHTCHSRDTISQRQCLAWSQQYLWWTLIRVLFTPRCPPDSLLSAIFDRLSVDSQWCFSMPPLTARDFHWAQ
jgi:hypothetical protein